MATTESEIFTTFDKGRTKGGTATARARIRFFNVAYLVAVLVLIIWPYAKQPGSILYNRYFEAAMIFNPVFAYQTYAAGWSYNLHLGYPSLAEPSYLSIFTASTFVFHAIGGIAFASHAFPAFVALFTFGCALAYLRVCRPLLTWPAQLLIALFFTVNPMTAGMVHEGYSGMMVDYALIPLGLALVDLALIHDRLRWLGALPLIFTATAMFKLPEVAIAWVVIGTMRWRVWKLAFLKNRTMWITFAASLTVNAYWFLPMFANLKLHAFLPVQDDTASEIAVSTQYSTLSNVLLGRVFGFFEHNAKLCDACDYYLSAEFTIGMLLCVGLAIWGLYRKRDRMLLAALALGLAMSTGFHYQDDLIGLPYQLLMQLPTFGIFRSANVFLIVVFFCYAIGLAAALERAATLSVRKKIAVWAGVISGIALASFPMFDGALLEKGTLVDGTVTSPNFYVSIPPAYSRVREELATLGGNGVTLIVPNESFATYRWGAYVQDFLPPYLNRPSLAQWYWRQNNVGTQQLLNTVSGAPVTATREDLLLQTMRIDTVLAHDDTSGGTVKSLRHYGEILSNDAGIHLLKTRRPIVPLTTQSEDPMLTLGGAERDSTVLASLTGLATREIVRGDSPIGCGTSTIGSGYFRGASRSGSPILLDATVRCPGTLHVSAYVSGGGRLPQLMNYRNHRILPAVTHYAHMNDGIILAFGDVQARRGDILGVLPHASGSEVFGITARRGLSEPPAVAAPFTMTLGATGIVQLLPEMTTFVYHESFDPSLIGFVLGKHVSLATKIEADGYANGWSAPPGAKLLIVNLAQGMFLIGCCISFVALLIAVWSLLPRGSLRQRRS